MHEKAKPFIHRLCIFTVSLALAFSVGFWHGHINIRASDDDSERAERYEERSDSAQNIVSGLKDGLGTVAEQMHGAGEQIESGITDVGELRAASDRIAETGYGVEDSAGRIGKGIQRIESILSEAEKSCEILENGGDGSGDNGGD